VVSVEDERVSPNLSRRAWVSVPVTVSLSVEHDCVGGCVCVYE